MLNEVLDLYNKGLSRDQIAKELNLPKPTIDGRIKILREQGQLNYRKAPWSEEEIKQLLELKAEGNNYYEIAQVLNRSYNAVKGKAATLWKEQPITAWYDKYQIEY